MKKFKLVNEDLPPVAAPTHVQFGQKVSEIRLPKGLGTYNEIMDELLGYTDVLKGDHPAPLESPYLTLMEVATGYLTRAYEIEMLIYRGEHDGTLDHEYSRLRTGPLSSFINMTRKLSDLGSRRLTQEDMLTRQRRADGERW